MCRSNDSPSHCAQSIPRTAQHPRLAAHLRGHLIPPVQHCRTSALNPFWSCLSADVCAAAYTTAGPAVSVVDIVQPHRFAQRPVPRTPCLNLLCQVQSLAATARPISSSSHVVPVIFAVLQISLAPAHGRIDQLVAARMHAQLVPGNPYCRTAYAITARSSRNSFRTAPCRPHNPRPPKRPVNFRRYGRRKSLYYRRQNFSSSGGVAARWFRPSTHGHKLPSADAPPRAGNASRLLREQILARHLRNHFAGAKRPAILNIQPALQSACRATKASTSAAAAGWPISAATSSV